MSTASKLKDFVDFCVRMAPESILRDFDQESLKVYRYGLENAVEYDFTGIELDTAHVAYGRELWLNDLIQLPFPVVSFKVQDHPDADGVTYPPHEFVAIQMAGKLIIFVTTETGPADPATNPGVRTYSMPILSLKLDMGSRQLDKTGIIYVRKGIQNLYTPEQMDMSQTGAVEMILACVGLLGTTYINVEKREPSAKLNKNRIAKGKPPINATNIITFKLSKPTESNGLTHDGRKAPKFHWRAGHLRHLQSGKVVKIAPVPVMASPEVRDKLAPPTNKLHKVVV